MRDPLNLLVQDNFLLKSLSLFFFLKLFFFFFFFLKFKAPLFPLIPCFYASPLAISLFPLLEILSSFLRNAPVWILSSFFLSYPPSFPPLPPCFIFSHYPVRLSLYSDPPKILLTFLRPFGAQALTPPLPHSFERQPRYISAPFFWDLPLPRLLPPFSSSFPVPSSS